MPKKLLKKSIKDLFLLNIEIMVKLKLSASLFKFAQGRIKPIAGKKVKTSLAILNFVPQIEYAILLRDL